MCTLTWEVFPRGYELHFNRDESRSRPRASLPEIHTRGSQQIYPTDTLGGTWISVNQAGVALCLLNNYLATNYHQGSISRGLLVKELSVIQNRNEAKRLFETIDLTNYSPFDLYVFVPNESPLRFSWCGNELFSSEPEEAFASSSGFDTLAVIKGRREQFLAFNGTDLAGFHRSHVPERSSFSVCMHRSDAMTQSYSRIRVTDRICEFWYTDGPPCESPVQGPWAIDRV